MIKVISSEHVIGHLLPLLFCRLGHAPKRSTASKTVTHEIDTFCFLGTVDQEEV